jgi:hypothetical protein
MFSIGFNLKWNLSKRGKNDQTTSKRIKLNVTTVNVPGMIILTVNNSYKHLV